MVQLDNMDNAKTLLQDIEKMFSELDELKRKMENEINLKEDETQDYLHELELAKLNGIEIMKIANALIKCRRARRELKNKLELLNTLKGYTDNYIKNGILAETRQTIQNIETLKQNQETREYTPKIIKGLKCAKKRSSKD